ncbi:LysM domain protein [Rhodobacteraceae bacterium KLH11]|nr:LysM domain protein [Rhodobacteraceae bacterium KLH11]
MPLVLGAGPALSAPLIQCPDWRQYVIEKPGAMLRSSPPKQSFEVAVANGKAVQAKTKSQQSPVQNKRTDPFPLPKGFWEKLKPRVKPAAASKSPAAGGATAISAQCRYVVVKGDTLSRIAAKKLGTVKRWKEIAQVNGLPGSSPLRPGQVLQLPCATGGKGPVQTPVQTVAPLPVWTARPGEYVSDVVARWGRTAGYKVTRDGVEEWKVIVPIVFQGSFQDALKELIRGFEGSGRPLPISIYANKVVRIGRPI